MRAEMARSVEMAVSVRAVMARKRAEMARSAEMALFVVRAVMARLCMLFRH